MEFRSILVPFIRRTKYARQSVAHRLERGIASRGDGRNLLLPAKISADMARRRFARMASRRGCRLSMVLLPALAT